MGIANRKLTNYFTGKMNTNQKSIKQYLADRFQFKIVNGCSSKDVTVALLTGDVDTTFVKATTTTTGEGSDATTETSYGLSLQNMQALKDAGYVADLVLEEGTVSIFKGNEELGEVTMQAGNGMSFANLRNYLRANMRMVKRVTITAAETNSDGLTVPCPTAFDHNIYIGQTSPFQHQMVEAESMSQHFQTTQYQSGKIVIDHKQDDLWLDDLLYASIEVQHGVTLNVTVELYAE